MKWLAALLLLAGCASVPENESGKKEYQAALQATTISARREGLNTALQKLLKAPSTAAALQNTANVMELLGEPAWGILYGYRALKLEPRNSSIEARLDEMISAARLPPRQKENPFGPLVRWHQILSAGEKFALLFVSLIALFFFSSFKVWRDSRVLVPLIALASVVSILLGGSLIYSRYGAPLEGVLIKPAALYREPSTLSLLVNEAPLSAGLKLDVLDEKGDGEWLKVKTAQGEYGYVYYTHIRLIP